MVDIVESGSKFYFDMVIFDFHEKSRNSLVTFSTSAFKNFFQFSIPGTAEELHIWRWKSRIRDSPWRQPSSALKISGMLGGGARINLIFGRSCRTRFARVRGEKLFSNRKGDLSQIFELWLPGLGNILIFLRISTAFTRPAGLDLVLWHTADKPRILDINLQLAPEWHILALKRRLEVH